MIVSEDLMELFRLINKINDDIHYHALTVEHGEIHLKRVVHGSLSKNILSYNGGYDFMKHLRIYVMQLEKGEFYD
jgi:hypothetical protein